ncbi:MAG: thioredoxin-disulfide reductase [Lachnospiraceae bacterium]|nr:thioredoxin-disulfide reductase [Lachnospiraceae bacterium]
MLYDVIIIGSGPAGLSAAIYAKRAKLETLVLEKAPMSGGQILNTYEVDNYPGIPGIGGFDLGTKFRTHADTMECEFVTAEVQKIEERERKKIVVTDTGNFETKTVIIASGASYKKLGVPGEEEFLGMGVSYCATCDGAFFRDKITAVVGGGDVALEDALFLSRVCEKVYLIHRRDEFRGAKILQERVQETENIEILWDTVVEQIRGGDQVENILVYNKKEESKKELTVNGIFIAVGISPNTEVFQGIVAMDEGGYIIAGEDGVTDIPGIFAAGDLRTKQLRQVVTAASDGANAVTSLEHYLYKLK